MAASLNDKARLLPFLPPVTSDYSPHVLDIGAGGGELAHALSELGYTVTALDANEDALRRIELAFPEISRVNALANHADDNAQETYDAIICSSILHEVYSYGDDVHRMGHLSSLHRAVEAFQRALKPNGVLLIRDGVKTDDWAEKGKIKLNFEYSPSVVSDYLTLSPFANGQAYGKQGTQIQLTNPAPYLYEGNNQSLMEFAYTFNWGTENYPREALELYGLLTLNEYAELVEDLGFTLTHSEAYLLPGYVEGLKGKLELTDDAGQPRSWFNSNAIWIFEKSPA
jgi:SAM-dependent methyltransferase